MSKETTEPEEAVEEKEQEASKPPPEEIEEPAQEDQEESEETPPAEAETAAEKPEKEEGAEEEEEEEKEEEEEAEAKGEEEEEIEIVEERVYTIPFRKVWATPRGKRTPRASRMLRDFVKRHMKVENVEISNQVNEELWARGIKKPPRQIKVRLVKDKEGRVIVYPATAA